MIRNFLDLSTAHVSPAARGWLDDQGYANGMEMHCEHTVAAFRDGWLVYAPSPESVRDTKLHPDLLAAAGRARGLDCDYLLFDRDAEVLPGLPLWNDDGAPMENPDDDEDAKHPAVTDHDSSPNDRNFLLWIRDRLTRVHGDNPDVDFIWKLEAIAMALPEGQRTPNAIADHPVSPWRDGGQPARSLAGQPALEIAEAVAREAFVAGDGPRAIPADVPIRYTERDRRKPVTETNGTWPTSIVNTKALAELKAAAEELSAMMDVALEQHIYDASNGEEPEPDCSFVAARNRVTAALAAL